MPSLEILPNRNIDVITVFIRECGPPGLWETPAGQGLRTIYKNSIRLYEICILNLSIHASATARRVVRLPLAEIGETVV